MRNSEFNKVTSHDIQANALLGEGVSFRMQAYKIIVYCLLMQLSASLKCPTMAPPLTNAESRTP